MSWDRARAPLCRMLALLSLAAGLAGIPTLAWKMGLLPGSLTAVYLINAAQETMIFALPSLLLLAAKAGRWRRFRRRCRPLTADTMGFCALLAAGGTVTVSLLAGLWASLWRRATGYAGAPLPLPGLADGWQTALSLLSVAVVPALSEELAFRAVLQQGLQRFWPRAGVWVAALCFAALHLRPEAFPALLLVGWALGRVYRKHGYFASALLHALYNAVTLLLSSRQVNVTLGMAAVCVFAAAFSLRRLIREDEK